tara:strand:+ start:150 stop:365 length:216 start_codon:yes stop_codon:yes gene_type:complete
MKDIENRILEFVELSQDDVFDTWTPSQRLYNAIEYVLNNPSDESSVLSEAVDLLSQIQDIFDNSKKVKGEN